MAQICPDPPSPAAFGARSRHTHPSRCASLTPIALAATMATLPPALHGQESQGALAEATERARGTITLEPLDGGAWRVTYRLDRPATTLRFARAARHFREEQWTVVTPGWRAARDGDSQVLTGDTPTDVVVVEMERYEELLPSEYRAFQPFSDGSFALYTGHLYLRDVADEVGTGGGEAPYLTSLSVNPPPGVTAVVLGESHVGPFEWTDPYGAAGTYIYFGSTPAVESPHLTAILDAGLPEWLVARATTLFPVMFEALGDGFDEALPWHPTILIAWEGADRGGRDWSGGALPGQIRMSLRGSDWEEEDERSAVELARFIAHEGAHFWNGQIVVNRLAEQSWIHEGGADAVAELVLRDLGLIDDETLHSAREVAINRCLSGLDGASINGAGSRDRFGDYYVCGHMMAVWAEAALGAAGVDLFTLWARLIDSVGPGGAYDQGTYLDVLRRSGASPAVTRAMASLADDDLADQRRTTSDGFAVAGATLVADGSRPPGPLRRDLARDAVTHLMSTGCEGRYSLSTYDRSLRIYRIDGCEAFSIESEVSSVAGHAVVDGDWVHDAVVAACEDGTPIPLGDPTGDTVLTVTCRAALAPKPAWTTLTLRR